MSALTPERIAELRAEIEEQIVENAADNDSDFVRDSVHLPYRVVIALLDTYTAHQQLKAQIAAAPVAWIASHDEMRHLIMIVPPPLDVDCTECFRVRLLREAAP